MPLVTGGSLAGRLRRQGPLAIEDTLRIARDVSDALEYAHEHGVVHRDISPQHILFDDDRALVKEFWIARALSRAPSVQNTMVGRVFGPGYTSPEQLGGGKVDARSDVYSLAVLIVQMLTNRLPFTGETPMHIIARQMSEARLKRKDLPPGLPEQVVDAVLVALARDPIGA